MNARAKKFITCDGNYAAAHIAYMFSEVAGIYPITPSSTMAELADEWASQGRKNLFGEVVKVIEMQSEAGAAGAVHGSLQAGALTTTFTASQGLLLMIPNMYKIAGELLPGVFHVSARSIAAQALSIFGDHSDVMGTRQTGFAMLATGSVQEIMDLTAVAHLSAIKSRVPFLHFFDGFRTSHEIQKIEMLENADFTNLVDMKALQAFRNNALNPEHPVTRGTAQNPDIYFQAREAGNPFYDALPEIVAGYMAEMSKLTGRTYKLFDYYGDPKAENIIIAMGSVTDTIKEVIDSLAKKGEKVGLVAVHLYRPFSAKHFFQAIPTSVKKIAVLDRTKEYGANAEPLFLDVEDIYYGKANAPVIVGGRYGLSSKDTTPSQIIAVYENLKAGQPKTGFTVGITDDVTHTSLPLLPEVNVVPEGTFQAKFYGIGSDGTVGANKNSIKIIGETTDKYCQAYISIDSKKSGGVTISHLRFGDKPIRSPYFITTPDFVACHVQSYLDKFDMLKGLKKGGTFLLNTIWDVSETKKNLPDHMKKYIAENNINFYIINATNIAEEIGLGNRTNTIMQSAFFKISNVIDYSLAEKEMKKMIEKSYRKKGEEIIKMNNAAIERGTGFTKVEIPSEWKSLQIRKESGSTDTPAFIHDFVQVINHLKGDDLPVSAFTGREDGTLPAGTAAYEKRAIAVNVPEWIPENCIQCNQCSYVCPHAAIRPFLVDDAEMKKMPASAKTLPAIGPAFKGLQYRMQLSVLDCAGCGNCADVCASKKKALVMKPIETQMQEATHWDFFSKNVTYKDSLAPKEANIKNSQFAQPLFEFSGACAGCGETPYVKLITQLFGERMMVANATGCSSIYGGSAPSTPYTSNAKGEGPAWANSLFEDNAEYGLGMSLGVTQMRDRISNLMNQSMAKVSVKTKEAFTEWLSSKNDAAKSKVASEKVLAALSSEKFENADEILKLKQYLVKKSIWIFGGDGWAYDIGFGGLDHVIASGEDVNILVLDTEVYSNTGGQASKSTPLGAVAKFAASGKRIRKKDLGMIAMSYGYVYVAQVDMGSNQVQYLKALREAEAYPGPSLIIAYAPCINHGFRNMGQSQAQGGNAVECGYWHLYRFNPLLEKEGKNPFQLDSKEPDWSKFKDFLLSEVRYSSLEKTFPKEAQELFAAAQENSKWRYNSYTRLSQMGYAK